MTLHSHWTNAEILLTIAEGLFYIKNSIQTHRPEDEYSPIRSRIAQTRDQIEKTAWQLDQLSSPKAASYLRGELDSMMTFAEEATAGFEVS